MHCFNRSKGRVKQGVAAESPLRIGLQVKTAGFYLNFLQHGSRHIPAFPSWRPLWPCATPSQNVREVQHWGRDRQTHWAAVELSRHSYSVFLLLSVMFSVKTRPTYLMISLMLSCFSQFLSMPGTWPIPTTPTTTAGTSAKENQMFCYVNNLHFYNHIFFISLWLCMKPQVIFPLSKLSYWV